MKTLYTLFIVLGFLISSSLGYADTDQIFPALGADYQMTYAAPKPLMRGQEPSGQFDSSISLRILKVQPNGWVLASRLSYHQTYSKKTAEKPLPEVIDRKLVISDPSWFNLSAFSEAKQIKND